MSACSAAPASSAETTVKTVAEPAVKTMNEAAVESVDESVVEMWKPLRYYDRRPEPEKPGLDGPIRIIGRIGIFGRWRNDIDLRRQSRRVLGDPPAPIRLLARLHDALLLLAADRYWNRVARAGRLVGGRLGGGGSGPCSVAGRRNDRIRLRRASRARQDQR